MPKPTERFSSCVADYEKYRPGYPAEVLEVLREACPTTDHAAIADIGAGTGILTRDLLTLGHAVHAVEPNDAMRQAMDANLSATPNYRSLPGTAEATGLDAASIGLIVAAQAFHWFKHDDARREFERVLKPGGQVALVWNERDMDDALIQDYDALLKAHIPEYDIVNYTNVSQDLIARFFGPSGHAHHCFRHAQHFDRPGLIGRFTSCSYAPPGDHPTFGPLMRGLENLYATHQRDGRIAFPYQTHLYLGGLS